MKNAKNESGRRGTGQTGIFLRPCIWSGVFALVCLLPFASKWIWKSISIDTEMMINTPQRMLTSWLYHERPGLVVSKYLFGQTSFHYGIEIAGTILFLTLFAVLLAWAAKRLELPAKWPNPFVWIFPLLFLTHPALTEQLHFLLQSMEIAWAVLLCLAACLLACSALWKRQWLRLVPALILMAWSFSSYQSLMGLYIALCAGLYLLTFDRYQGEGRKAAFWWKLALLHVLVFGAGFLLSRAAAIAGLYISTGSFQSTAYVSGMIKWGTQPATQCLRELFSYGRQILLGQGPHYTLAYLAAALGTLLTLAWQYALRKKTGEKAPAGSSAYWIAGVILYLSPFLLPLYLGGADQVRAQLALAFVIAFGWCYLILLLRRMLLGRTAAAGRPARFSLFSMRSAFPAACLLACLFGILQFGQTVRLTYTAYEVYRQECEVSRQIAEAIEQTGAPEDAKVQFVGRLSPALTENMVRGETIGWSFYEWDAEKAYGSSERILGLWQTLGYEYQLISQEEAAGGMERAGTMPCWPEEGSVTWDGSTVIVRLS